MGRNISHSSSYNELFKSSSIMCLEDIENKIEKRRDRSIPIDVEVE